MSLTSKSKIMQTDAKVSTRAIRVANHSTTITLKIDKKQVVNTIRRLTLLLFFLTLGTLLITSYNKDNSQFWPLLKVSVIIGLVAFMAIKSNNNFKKTN